MGEVLSPVDTVASYDVVGGGCWEEDVEGTVVGVVFSVVVVVVVVMVLVVLTVVVLIIVVVVVFFVVVVVVGVVVHVVVVVVVVDVVVVVVVVVPTPAPVLVTCGSLTHADSPLLGSDLTLPGTFSYLPPTLVPFSSLPLPFPHTI